MKKAKRRKEKKERTEGREKVKIIHGEPLEWWKGKKQRKKDKGEEIDDKIFIEFQQRLFPPSSLSLFLLFLTEKEKEEKEKEEKESDSKGLEMNN